MALLNEDYLKLPENYLFTEIHRKVNIFKITRPGSKVIHLDAGDSNHILQGEYVDTFRKNLEMMASSHATKSTDIPERLNALETKILKTDYESNGIKLSVDDIFISDDPRNAAADVLDLLSRDNIIGVFDPSYPAFIYNTVMSGRSGLKMEDGRWSNLVYLPCNAENNFVPSIPKERVDVVYLSLPNNPTGTTLTTDELKKWVKYANDTHTLIIYDASHAHYVRQKKVPRSIYEIKGAQKVAIELRSFSKTTGYTGTNFGFTIIPSEVVAYTEMGKAMSLNQLCRRRQTSKFSGIPYLGLCAAEALYTAEGQKQMRQIADYYMTNAMMIKEKLQSIGLTVAGGDNSPYLWVKTPDGVTSWRFFEQMLYEKSIVCTPGVGFCPGGEGYVRFSGFSEKSDVEEAMSRL